MVKKDWYSIKINSSEECKNIQNEAFNAGYLWNSGDKKFRSLYRTNYDSYYLIFDTIRKRIMHSNQEEPKYILIDSFSKIALPEEDPIYE